MVLAHTVHEIYSCEAVGFAIFARFLNFDNCKPKAVSDVISGVAVGPMGVKVRGQCGYSRSNHSRDIQMSPFVTNDDDAGRRTLCQ